MPGGPAMATPATKWREATGVATRATLVQPARCLFKREAPYDVSDLFEGVPSGVPAVLFTTLRRCRSGALAQRQLRRAVARSRRPGRGRNDPVPRPAADALTDPSRGTARKSGVDLSTAKREGPKTPQTCPKAGF